jgi:hypothetical protein
MDRTHESAAPRFWPDHSHILLTEPVSPPFRQPRRTLSLVNVSPGYANDVKGKADGIPDDTGIDIVESLLLALAAGRYSGAWLGMDDSIAPVFYRPK